MLHRELSALPRRQVAGPLLRRGVAQGALLAVEDQVEGTRGDRLEYETQLVGGQPVNRWGLAQLGLIIN